MLFSPNVIFNLFLKNFAPILKEEFRYPFLYPLNVNSLPKDNGMTYANGVLTIRVSSEWLDWADDNGWFTSGAFKPDVRVETSTDPMYMIILGGIGVLVVASALAIILAMISIKKKKADYAVALEKFKKSNERLEATQRIGDVVKGAKAPPPPPTTGGQG